MKLLTVITVIIGLMNLLAASSENPQVSSSISVGVTPSFVPMGGWTTVEWYTLLTKGSLAIQVLLDGHVVTTVNYTHVGVASGLVNINNSSEGTHTIQLSTLQNNCFKNDPYNAVNARHAFSSPSVNAYNGGRNRSSDAAVHGVDTKACLSWQNRSLLFTAYAPIDISQASLALRSGIVYIPPGLAFLSFTLNLPSLHLYSAGYHLLTTVDWGDGENNETVTQTMTSHASDTSAAATSTLPPHTFHLNIDTDLATVRDEYEYRNPGTFNCSLKFANPVFEEQLFFQMVARVRSKVGHVLVLSETGALLPLAPIPWPFLGFTAPPVVATPNTTLTITTKTALAPAITRWTLYSPAGNTSQPKLPFIIDFPEEGQYTVYLSLEGADGPSLPQAAHILVRRLPKTPVVLVQPTLVRAGQQVAVGVMVPQILGSCLILDLGDGTPSVGWRNEERCDVTPPGTVLWRLEPLLTRVTERGKDPQVAERGWATRLLNCSRLGVDPPAYCVTCQEMILYLHSPSDISLVRPTATLYSLWGRNVSKGGESAEGRVLAKGPCKRLEVSLVGGGARSRPPTVVTRADLVRMRLMVTTQECEEGTEARAVWMVQPTVPTPSSPTEAFRQSLRHLAGADAWPASTMLYDAATEERGTVSMEGAADTGSTTFVLPPYLLQYGEYHVKVYYNVSKTDESGNVFWAAASASVPLRVVPGQLKVGAIRGGAVAVTRARIYFDAAGASTDPDQADGVLSRYEWWCKNEGEDWPADEGVIRGPSTPPSTDGGGCFGEGPGKLPPSAGDGALLDIGNEAFYRIPRTVVLRVMGHSVDGRNATAELKVLVVSGDPPVLLGGCFPSHVCHHVPGGGLFASPNRLVMQADCERVPWFTPPEGSNCPAGIVYSWRAFGMPNLEQPDQLEELGIQHSNTTTSLTSRSLVLLDEFWSLYGAYARLVLTVTAQKEGEQYSGSSTFLLVVNKPPENGSCYVVPASKIPDETDSSDVRPPSSAAVRRESSSVLLTNTEEPLRSSDFFSGPTSGLSSVTMPLPQLREPSTVDYSESVLASTLFLDSAIPMALELNGESHVMPVTMLDTPAAEVLASAVSLHSSSTTLSKVSQIAVTHSAISTASSYVPRGSWNPDLAAAYSKPETTTNPQDSSYFNRVRRYLDDWPLVESFWKFHPNSELTTPINGSYRGNLAAAHRREEPFAATDSDPYSVIASNNVPNSATISEFERPKRQISDAFGTEAEHVSYGNDSVSSNKIDGEGKMRKNHNTTENVRGSDGSLVDAGSTADGAVENHRSTATYATSVPEINTVLQPVLARACNTDINFASDTNADTDTNAGTFNDTNDGSGTAFLAVVTALVESVVIECSGWIDPEGGNVAKYTFYGLTPNMKRLPLSFGIAPRTSVVLPFSSPSSDAPHDPPTLELWAALEDGQHSTVHHRVGTVLTQLPTVDQVQEYEDKRVRAAAVDALQQLLVGQLLQAEESIRGHRLPGAKMGPPTEEELEAAHQRALTGNSEMVAVLGNFGADSMDEVVQVTGILGAVADPLPADAQDSALTSLQGLAGAVSPTATPGQAAGMANTATGVVGALVKGINKNVQSGNRSVVHTPTSIIVVCRGEDECWTNLALCLSNNSDSSINNDSNSNTSGDSNSNTSGDSNSNTNDATITVDEKNTTNDYEVDMQASAALQFAHYLVRRDGINNNGTAGADNETLTLNGTVTSSTSSTSITLSCQLLEVLGCALQYWGTAVAGQLFGVTYEPAAITQLLEEEGQGLQREEDLRDNCSAMIRAMFSVDRAAAEANKKVEAALGVSDSVQGPLLRGTVAGQEPARVEAGAVSMAVGLFDARSLRGRRVTVGGAVYEMPGYCAIIGRQDDCMEEGVQRSVGVKMARWSDPVYGFAGNADTLGDGSATLQLSLVDETFNPIDVRNSLENFIMYIPQGDEDRPDPTFFEHPGQNHSGSWMIHRLQPPGPDIGILIELRFGPPPPSPASPLPAVSPPTTDAVNDDTSLGATTPGSQLEASLSVDAKEYEGVYEQDEAEEDNILLDTTWLVGWGTTSPGNKSTFEYIINVHTNFTFNYESGYYELFLSSEWLKSNTPLPGWGRGEGRAVGEYFLGVAEFNETAALEELLTRNEDYDEYYEEVNEQEMTAANIAPNQTIDVEEYLRDSPNVSHPVLGPPLGGYSVRTSFSSCLFFDKKTLSWSSDGCKVVAGNSSTTVCACNHLTAFSSGFIPAPNPIDFSYVFANAGFAENLTIYLTIILSLSLYIIGMVYARIMDRRDLQFIGATPLPENRTEDRYVYELFVFTGFQPNSGTKSKVSFVLAGDWEDSDVRTLQDDTRPILRTGAQDHFVLTTPRCLGPLQYLRIWHDNSGKGSSASWLFSHLLVRDPQTGERWQFICDAWLAVEEGDGMIDRLVPVAGIEQLQDVNHVLGKKVQRAIQDDHLWFSVFLRPPRSRFTRVQRLSSCMALVYLSMLVNAMFYNVVPESGGSINMGFARISPAALGVGFISNLIVFPPSFAIVYFFRKSRPKKDKPSRVKEALQKTERDKRDHLDEMLGVVLGKKSVRYSDANSELAENLKEPPQNVKMAFAETTEENSATGSAKSRSSASRQRKRRLPHYFRYVAWVLCAVCILVSVFFLWAYGIMFGNEKTTRWLTALLSSIISSVLVTQPLKIYMTAMLLSWILRRPLDLHDDYDDDEIDPDLDTDLDLLHPLPSRIRKDGNPQHKSGRLVGSGISPEQLEAAKKRRLNQVAMNGLLADIAVYMAFVTIIGTLCYATTDPNILGQNQHFKRNLADEVLGDNVTQFFEVDTTDDYYDWLETSLVPFLYDETLYNGGLPDALSKGTLRDRVSFVMGRPILRQIRIKKGSCGVHPIMTSVVPDCTGEAEAKHEDEGSYGPGWEGNVKKPHSYFTFHSSLSVHGVPYTGDVGRYGGGGYFVELHRPLSRSLRTLGQMRELGWIDKYTRALFTEISIYNPQINLFGVVLLVAEMVPGGGIFTSFRYQGFNLLRYHGPGGMMVLVCELIFVLFTVFFTRREWKVVKKEGWRNYFSSLWNYLEVIVIVLAMISIVFYLFKTAYTYWLLDMLTESKGRKNIRMQSLAVFDKTLSQIIAFMLFIATIKLLRLLRFNKRIGYLSATLKLAGPEIIGFFTVLLVTIISFVSVFHIIARANSKNFSTFITAVETSFFVIDQYYDVICDLSPIVGPLAFFTYTFMMYFVVIPFLIAIVCSAFSLVKANLSAQPNDYEVVEYMMTVATALVKRLKASGGNQKIQPSEEGLVLSNLDLINKKLEKALGSLQQNTKAYQSPFG